MANELYQNIISLPEVMYYPFELSFGNWSLSASSSLCLNLFRPPLGAGFLTFPNIADLSHSLRVTFSNRLQTGFPRSILSLKYWCAWSVVNQEVTCLGISKISHPAGLIMTIHHVCEAKFLIQSLQSLVSSVFLALAFLKCALGYRHLWKQYSWWFPIHGFGWICSC